MGFEKYKRIYNGPAPPLSALDQVAMQTVFFVVAEVTASINRLFPNKELAIGR